MKSFSSSIEFQSPSSDADKSFMHMTVGNFDGLHLGHQRLISQVLENKTAMGGMSAVYTFAPHPRAYFNPQFEHVYLQDRESWRRVLESEWGIDCLIEEKFTKDFAETPAEDFLDKYFGRHLRLKTLTVGEDFRFGQKRKGDVEMLKAWCHQHSIGLYLIPPVEIDGVRVSTTLIRDCLIHGDLVSAEKYLGHHFSISGSVAHGHQRGRILGFPTLNLLDQRGTLLKRGVYLSWVRYRDEQNVTHKWPSLTNVGIRPTIHDQSALVIESHVLKGLQRSLYGEQIEVEFIRFVREEKRFAGLDELKNQIAADVKVAQTFFKL